MSGKRKSGKGFFKSQDATASIGIIKGRFTEKNVRRW